MDAVRDADRETVGVSEPDREMVGVSEPDREMVGVSEPDREMVGVSEPDREMVGVCDGVRDTDAVSEGERETEGVHDALRDVVGVSEMVRLQGALLGGGRAGEARTDTGPRSVVGRGWAREARRVGSRRVMGGGTGTTPERNNNHRCSARCRRPCLFERMHGDTPA
jgi:hypothetical protein